jgi:hypothetical protein
VDELQRVTFRFGRETQIHYIAKPPQPGDWVTYGRARVEEDAVGPLVVCERQDAQVPSETD